MLRKTKIICTIGPVTSSVDMLSKMAEQGMNIARLNMSHGDHQSHSEVIENIKKANAQRSEPVAILLDTQGPEIRTGNISDDFKLTKGDEITVSVRGEEDVENSSLHINYEDLIDSVAEGDRITVDNGLINLVVLAKHKRSLTCQVEDGGVVKSKRHVNLPGIRVNLPSITEKDRQDIQFAIEHDLDFIALSFVRDAQDVRQLRTILDEQQSNIKIVAKIENHEGIENIAEIIQEADAVMVARGDLGVEIPIEDLPNVQRMIVKACATAGKPSIVATHLLESMIENPIPTRAEVTDVANAVYEEVDAIMLSGETTVGKYPLKCIEYLDKIAKASEKDQGLQFNQFFQLQADKPQLAKAAIQLAESVKAAGIIVITRRGRMSGFASQARPHLVPIYAFTFSEQVQRQLNLQRFVNARIIEQNDDAEVMLEQAFASVKEHFKAEVGDDFVVLSDVLSNDNVNAIQLRKLV